MEVSPGIFQFKVPLPDNPLGYINAYLIKAGQDAALIDTGWNTDEAYSSLTGQLREAGVSWSDLKQIIITHAHPDHYGLAGRLVEQTQAELVIHEIEMSLLRSRYVDVQPLLEEMNQWLRINGVPDDGRPELQFASMALLGLVAVALPNRIVRGGEHLQFGDLDFEVIWTPGHSAGHICLYERTRRLFFSGDHVLPRISPSVGMHVQAISNPLLDYQNALNQVARLPVDLVLPAHGEVFQDLAGRVNEILEHHKLRLEEILQALAGGPQTAYQVASRITWSTGRKTWQELQPFVRRMAVTETLAHLELLFGQNRLDKDRRDGLIWYRLAD